MTTIRVDTGISGSHCVVWLGKDEYVDARKTNCEGFTSMEYVLHGFVKHNVIVRDNYAPETIMEFIRSLYYPNSLPRNKSTT